MKLLATRQATEGSTLQGGSALSGRKDGVARRNWVRRSWVGRKEGMDGQEQATRGSTVHTPVIPLIPDRQADPGLLLELLRGPGL